MMLATVYMFVFIVLNEAKIFSHCGLATTLFKKYGIPKSQLKDWVCMAVAESSLNSSAIGPLNTDGSQDYGIFQINSKYWCSGGPHSGINGCNVTCLDLVTSMDLTPSITCAKLIHEMVTFTAWVGWNKKCAGKNLTSYTADCNL